MTPFRDTDFAARVQALNGIYILSDERFQEIALKEYVHECHKFLNYHEQFPTVRHPERILRTLNEVRSTVNLAESPPLLHAVGQIEEIAKATLRPTLQPAQDTLTTENSTPNSSTGGAASIDNPKSPEALIHKLTEYMNSTLTSARERPLSTELQLSKFLIWGDRIPAAKLFVLELISINLQSSYFSTWAEELNGWVTTTEPNLEKLGLNEQEEKALYAFIVAHLPAK